MSENENHGHESLIKTPKQLIVVVVLAFVVPVGLMLLLVQLVLGGKQTDSAVMTPEAVATRIKPVADVSVGGAAAASASASAAAGKSDGKKIYESACIACHGAGVAGAPKFGDKAAWAPHLAHGVAALYQSALKGKNAMPPKGGNASLSDADVKAVVDYMVGAAK